MTYDVHKRGCRCIFDRYNTMYSSDSTNSEPFAIFNKLCALYQIAYYDIAFNRRCTVYQSRAKAVM